MQSKNTNDKQRQLKKNVEINTARSILAEEKNFGTEVSSARKQEFRNMFEDSACRIDRKGVLDDVWNAPAKTEIDTSTRPDLGYFSGVNFDKNGKIIR